MISTVGSHCLITPQETGRLPSSTKGPLSDGFQVGQCLLQPKVLFDVDDWHKNQGNTILIETDLSRRGAKCDNLRQVLFQFLLVISFFLSLSMNK